MNGQRLIGLPLKTPTTAAARRRRRHLRGSLAEGILFGSLILVALSMGLVAMPLPTATAVAAPATRTVVSLTFDDGYATVQAARTALAEHNMDGTFYIPSGLVGQPGRLTWEDVRGLQAEGNEIGGHTVNHLHLDALDDAEQARQVCDDRAALINQGLRVTNFAYPYGASGPSTGAIVKNCGYNSARGDGGFSVGCKNTCPSAEPMPPEDMYSIRTAAPVGTTTSLSMIKEQITEAETRGGGWVPLVFHDVCDHCSDMAISPASFAELLDWLQSRAATGTTVATVAQVVGGDSKPTVAGPADSRPLGQLENPSLEMANTGNEASEADDTTRCLQRAGYGINTANWSRVRTGRFGSWAEQVTMTAYQSGDQKLMYQQDSGSCAPSIAPGQSYALSAWYNSSVPTRMVAYYRSTTGAWVFWAQSPEGPSSADWRQITWQTPVVPADATRISFGLQLASVGTLTADDYGMSVVNAPKAAEPIPASPWQSTLLFGGLLALIALPALGLILAVAIWARAGNRIRPIFK